MTNRNAMPADRNIRSNASTDACCASMPSRTRSAAVVRRAGVEPARHQRRLHRAAAAASPRGGRRRRARPGRVRASATKRGSSVANAASPSEPPIWRSSELSPVASVSR